MLKVVRMFHDLQDNAHEYNIGDTYPREGYEPSLSRIEELASDQNLQGVPLIVRIDEDPEEPKEPETPAQAKPKRSKSKKDPE